jgi:hypothetical protein
MSTTITRPEPAEATPVETGEADPLREAAIASLKRKRKFAEDAVAYVSVNGVLWLIWALTDRSTDGSIPWPAWVSLIWGFFLAIDAWRTYGRWPRSLHRPITEEEIERELKRSP